MGAENLLKPGLGTSGAFTITVEYTVPDVAEPFADDLAKLAEFVGQDTRVAGMALTDRVPSLTTHDTVDLAVRAAAVSGKMPLVHISGKNRNQDNLREQLQRLIDHGLPVEEALVELGRMVGARGTVLPASTEPVTLTGLSPGDRPVEGQVSVQSAGCVRRVGIRPADPPTPAAVGRALAERLGLDYLDTDQELIGRLLEARFEAFEAAGDPARYPGTGEPWQPSKLYYDRGFSRDRVVAYHEAMVEAGLDSPFAEWLQGWEPGDEPPVTTRVPCAEHFTTRDIALKAHATQVDPVGWWFALPVEERARIWPTEDFELARSLVDVRTPEEDLFEGLRERVPG